MLILNYKEKIDYKMGISRTKKAKLNIFVSLGCQILTLLCGFIVPRMMIGAFGSEVYGATASITQFLAYITLLEAGVGGVARSVLYKPLAENDINKINAILAEIKQFFRVIAYIFVVYVLILAFAFEPLSGIKSLDKISTIFLVIIISISTFAQYFIGISNSILLQAAQKSYITNIVSITGTVINTIFVVILVNLGCNVLIVKLISSCIFTLRPVALWYYVKKEYAIEKQPKSDKIYLKQKWDGLGQHIAFFLHSNTDIVVLTCFANLSAVAVYSVHNMIVSNMKNLTVSFLSGMEALFGDMLARKETDKLHAAFTNYETMISIVSVILFSAVAVLIVPFVHVYTKGIVDVNYHAPVFAVLLAIVEMLYCLRMPYHSVVIAAGHFRQTKIAAYGEAVINVLVSIVLVKQFGLIGVACGTLAATFFRFVYYVVYLNRYIMYRKIGLFVKRMLINTIGFALSSIAGSYIISAFQITNYGIWCICGVLVTITTILIVFVLNFFFYRENCAMLLNVFARKKVKSV